MSTDAMRKAYEHWLLPNNAQVYWTTSDAAAGAWDAAWNSATLAERERAAKVCEDVASDFGGVAEGPFVTDFGKHTHQAMAAGAQNCAASIRGEE